MPTSSTHVLAGNLFRETSQLQRSSLGSLPTVNSAQPPKFPVQCFHGNYQYQLLPPSILPSSSVQVNPRFPGDELKDFLGLQSLRSCAEIGSCEAVTFVMMALFFLGMLMLVRLPCLLASGSVVAHPDYCSAVVSILKSVDGIKFEIGGEEVLDDVLICEALELYVVSGCFGSDSHGEAWKRVGEEFCGRGFAVSDHAERNTVSVNLLEKAGRKLLLQPAENIFILDELKRKNHSNADKEQSKFCLEPDHVAVAVPVTFLLCCTILCPCFRAKRKDPNQHTVLPRELSSIDSVSSLEVSSTSERIPGTPLRVPPSPSRFSPSPQLTRIGSIHLGINQIIKATRNFSPSMKIGEGGFGTVYRANLPDGQVVAIKRAKQERFAAIRAEFSNEVELLTKIEHRNLVRLLGYTESGNERIIITEYVPNGTLREHLDRQHGKILSFAERLEIVIDVAHGLTYLHLYAEKTIIHRDVKSSNILLTENFRAKVADFGFARAGPSEADQTHISTKVKGTAGYLDPEYLKTYQLTPKSDVYSFGILLVEIFSGRRPVELKGNVDERITIRWAFKKYNEDNAMEVLDPLLEEAVDEEVFKKMLDLAFQCAAPTRADRPAMKEVVEQLWQIRRNYERGRRRTSATLL